MFRFVWIIIIITINCWVCTYTYLLYIIIIFFIIMMLSQHTQYPIYSTINIWSSSSLCCCLIKYLFSLHYYYYLYYYHHHGHYYYYHYRVGSAKHLCRHILFCFFFVWRVIGFIWLYVPIELNSAVLAINSGTNYSPYNCILTSKKYAIFIIIPVYDLWFVICIIFVCFCPVFVLCVHSTCTIILTTKPKLNWLII